MKKNNAIISSVLGLFVLLALIQPVLALNNYAVCEGANFKWEATKYLFQKDGLGLGNDLYINQNYLLEFNFTNFANPGSGDYLNGTINADGTVFVGSMSHKYYYGFQSSNYWVTEIIDTQGDYKVYVYLICSVEIAQTTKPNLQSLSDNTWIDMVETTPNNFTLSGEYVDGDDSYTYTGRIEFNSDKVLKYVYDELKTYHLGVLQRVERYIWNLTYYAEGTGTCGGDHNNEDDNDVPGYSVFLLISSILLGVVIIMKKKESKIV